MLGCLLTAIVLGAFYLTLGRPQKAQVVVHAPPNAAAGVAPAATPTLQATATPASVTVFVSGAVARPNIYTLPGGARVADALEAAGGLLPDAAHDAVNLAILLRDEAQIYVPLQSETVALPLAGASGATRGVVVDAGILAVPPVNLNQATSAELESLPGIGPAKAQAIIANRPYGSVDELDRVPGIGPATLEELRSLITAP